VDHLLSHEEKQHTTSLLLYRKHVVSFDELIFTEIRGPRLWRVTFQNNFVLRSSVIFSLARFVCRQIRHGIGQIGNDRFGDGRFGDKSVNKDLW